MTTTKMTLSESETDELILRADQGDQSAVQRLLGGHRDRLRRMVALRIDPRLSARLDPSDVIQEALTEAAVKLPAYLRDRPLPFYPWLRRIAWERLIRVHEQHVQAGKRTVRAEAPWDGALGDGSAMLLAARLFQREDSPSRRMMLDEMRHRVRAALDQLAMLDREVLVLRYLEQLSINETAATLDISAGAVSMRQLRALRRMQVLLQPDDEENPS